MAIHPSAIVDSNAQISPTAAIGAYAIVERGVTIADDVKVFPHAYVAEGTTLDRGVQVHPFAVVGHHPQDLAWDGSPSYTHVGERTIIREHASVHRGTMPGSTTVVGRHVFMMAMTHVGHNCHVGDEVILTSGTLLAGHVQIGRKAMLGGGTLLHQFCRVGDLAMVASCAVRQDIPPYMLTGPRGVVGLNVVGLRRAKFGADERAELRSAYRLLYRSNTPFSEAVRQLAEQARSEPARFLAAFLNAPSKRGILGYRRGGRERPVRDMNL